MCCTDSSVISAGNFGLTAMIDDISVKKAGAPNQNSILFQIVAIAALWATAFAFIKVAAQAGMQPLTITAARSALMAIVIALWLFMTKSKFSTDRVTLRHMVVVGFLNGLFPNALIALAMLQIENAPAAMILASVPILVAVFGNFILPQDRLDLRQWFGILVGFIGVLIVMDPRAVVGSDMISWGAIAMLGAAVSYAATTIYLRVTKSDDPYSTALGQQIVSTVLALALMVVWEPQQDWPQSVSIWLALAGLAVVVIAVPNILFFKLLSQQVKRHLLTMSCRSPPVYMPSYFLEKLQALRS